MKIFTLYVKQCIRSKEVQMSLVLLLLLGTMAIAIGYKHLEKKQQAIAEVSAYQKTHFDRQIVLHNDDLGLLLYYTKFSFINTLSPLSGISIGQSDINPTVKQITIKTFEAQRFDTDLVNPMNLQSGNLDLSFIIIYLIPLLVIVLTFNVLSEETETGTWKLVSVQTKSKLRFLASKIIVRGVLIIAVMLLLFLIAKVVLDIPLTFDLLLVIILSLVYLIFWMVLAFVVIIFKKSSGFNALLLLSLWLFLLILVPAGINNYVSSTYPVPEALTTAIAQRDGYHVKWDTDKVATIQKFYDHYPEFRFYGFPTEGFNWLWYYAMQQMGDDDSQQQREALDAKIRVREQASRALATMVPNMHVQLVFNRLAGTSTTQQLKYLDATKDFHEQLRLFFYPKVFNKSKADTVPWEDFKPAYYKTKSELGVVQTVLPVAVIILILIIISIPMLRRL